MLPNNGWHLAQRMTPWNLLLNYPLELLPDLICTTICLTCFWSNLLQRLSADDMSPLEEDYLQ